MLIISIISLCISVGCLFLLVRLIKINNKSEEYIYEEIEPRLDKIENDFLTFATNEEQY